MIDGIIAGIGGTVGALVIVGLVAIVARQWKSPKRIDRIEAVIVPMVRGVWALLGLHIEERNGNTDPEIKEAYAELTKVITKGVVSQKGSK